MIIRLTLFLIIISLILFTAGCCQLGDGLASFLEEAGSAPEAEAVDAADESISQDEEIVEDEDQEKETDSPQPDVPCWIVTLGGSGRDYAPSITPVEDGYVAVGMTTSCGLGTGTNNLDDIHDFMAVKLNKDGELIWSTVIGVLKMNGAASLLPLPEIRDLYLQAPPGHMAREMLIYL